MKLSKPILIQYLVVYIVMNMNYFDWYDTIDNSKRMINFRKKMQELSKKKWDLEVELVKCSGLDDKKTFFEMKKVIKKKLYDKPECRGISKKLVKVIMEKNKRYYSKQTINYMERVLKYATETNNDLKKFSVVNNIEKLNDEIRKYIDERTKDLKKNKDKTMLKHFKVMVKEFGYLDGVSASDVKKRVKILIKSNEDIIKMLKQSVRNMKKGMKESTTLTRRKVFDNYNKYSLNFV